MNNIYGTGKEDPKSWHQSSFIKQTCYYLIITGFFIASHLINKSFDNWSESPIKTTIETRPISEITFPKVTVCPPKNTFTDLNLDLMMLENKTLTNETKEKLINLARQELLVQDEINLLSNLSKIEEEKRYYNWHYGFTKIGFPVWTASNELQYYIETSATTGTVKTQYFGEKYDHFKIEKYSAE